MKKGVIWVIFISSCVWCAMLPPVAPRIHRGNVEHCFVDTLRYAEERLVMATVYHAVEEQCDSDCLVTASGAKISSADTAYEHRYIAVSRDLLDVFPYGTKVEVIGCGALDGEWVVQDTMNRRYKGYIDLLINPDMKGGKWEGVRVRKVNSMDEES